MLLHHTSIDGTPVIQRLVQNQVSEDNREVSLFKRG